MAKKRRHKKRRHLRVGRLILLILIVLALTAGIFVFHYKQQLRPVAEKGEAVRYTVSADSSLKQVTAGLEEAGLIRSANAAYYYMALNGNKTVYAGDFSLSPAMTTQEIMDTISDQSNAIIDEAKITIIEGDWCKDIATKISEATNVTYDELIALWNDADYIRSLSEKYPFLSEEMFSENVRCYLEGYLAPDTYSFYPETDAKTVTEKILDQTLVEYDQFKDDISVSSWSVHQIYTLASIVQYEASSPEDMAKVAQVFYNRLNAQMPLQSSVTVCYALDLDKSTQSWMACEVNSKLDSPYNTYLHQGLPPGPIMNPGAEALNAVLHPDSSMEGYYYFMADVNTGEIHYAKTLEEHNANVAQYGVVH